MQDVLSTFPLKQTVFQQYSIWFICGHVFQLKSSKFFQASSYQSGALHYLFPSHTVFI